MSGTKPKGSKAKPKTDTVALNFDPESLTIGQIEQLEDIAGTSLSDLVNQLQAGQYKAKTIKAIVFLLMSADDPNFTLEDASKMKLSTLLEGLDLPPAAAPAGESGNGRAPD